MSMNVAALSKFADTFRDVVELRNTLLCESPAIRAAVKEADDALCVAMSLLVTNPKDGDQDE